MGMRRVQLWVNGGCRGAWGTPRWNIPISSTGLDLCGGVGTWVEVEWVISRGCGGAWPRTPRECLRVEMARE